MKNLKYTSLKSSQTILTPSLTTPILTIYSNIQLTYACCHRWYKVKTPLQILLTHCYKLGWIERVYDDSRRCGVRGLFEA